MEKATFVHPKATRVHVNKKQTATVEKIVTPLGIVKPSLSRGDLHALPFFQMFCEPLFQREVTHRMDVKLFFP